MTTLVHKTASAAKWSALDVFMRQGVQFVVTVILARILTPEEFGVVALLSLFVGVAAVFIDGGLSSALVQRQNTTQTDESTVFFFNLGMGAVSGVLICAAAPWIAVFFNQPVLQYLSYAMALSLFVGAFGSIHTALLNKEMNFKIAAKVGAVSSLVGGAVAIYMASQGYGVWSLVGHTVVSGIGTVLSLWMWHPWRPGWSFSVASLRSLFRFGGYEMASTLLDVFETNLHSILIGKMYSVRDVGLFTRARNTQLIPVTVMMSIVQRVAYSAFSLVAEDKARLVRGLRQAQAVAMFINMPLMVGVIVLAEPLVLTLFGDQWLPCVPMLQVLGLGGILWPLHILNLNILRAQGHSGLRFRVEVIKKAVAISLTVAASYYGIMAIAWAQVAISVCSYFVNTHYTNILLNYSGLSQLRDLAMNFAAVIPMVAAMYLMTDIMQALPIIELVVVGTMGCGIYLLTCRLLCAELLSQSLMLAGVRTRPVQT
ncbi:MAG: lipopolysaccharide biosynthesis protein [Nitrospira sp.]|nr:lipopolysaccharide biosynthesis protein [Nitrospira sp.]